LAKSGRLGYNFRARARAVLPVSILAQGVRAPALPTASSQVSTSQIMEMLEKVETVPETEMSGSGNDLNLEIVSQNEETNSSRKSQAATQPSHPATAVHSNFTYFTDIIGLSSTTLI